jgi:hypothetical protein
MGYGGTILIPWSPHGEPYHLTEQKYAWNINCGCFFLSFFSIDILAIKTNVFVKKFAFIA